MAAGTLQYIIECVPTGTKKSVSPCVNDAAGNGHTPSMVQAYVLNPSSASFIDAVAQPFDYATGSAFFGFGFTGVCAIFLIAHSIGLVLKFVRDH